MIERLAPPVSEADLRSLALLLVDAVESGAAVSFLSLTEAQALDWWRKLFGAPALRHDLSSSPATPRASSARCSCIRRGRRTSRIARTSPS